MSIESRKEHNKHDDLPSSALCSVDFGTVQTIFPSIEEAQASAGSPPNAKFLDATMFRYTLEN